MAIARVTSSFATANSGAASGTTLTLTLGVTPTAGNIVVVAICCFGTSGTPGPGSCALTATGITWIAIVPLVQGNSQNNTMLAIGRVFASPSATINITTVSAGGIAAAGAEYSGVSALVDKFASGTGSSNSAATGATGTTTVANELFVCAVGSRGTNGVTFSSPGDGFTLVGQTNSTLNTSADRSVAFLEKIVSATTTASPTLTISAVNIYVAVVATLEQTPSGGAGGLMRHPGNTGGCPG